MLTALLLAQGAALVVLIARLLPGRRRRPPVEPVEDRGPPRVSVLLPTLNEARRVRPCLEGLLQQGPTVREIVVIDGNSTDETLRLVDGATAHDSRLRVIRESPLPNEWIGKVWALQQGLEQTSGEWVLNVDADIEPRPGMVAAAVQVAEELKLDVVSFSPCFAEQTAAEQWVQAALVVTLVYRCGVREATGEGATGRLMANGQCFLARRAVLQAHGGYAPARASFSDDVTLARYLAGRGARVGFLDGSRLFSVRAYYSLGEMWREWGRSVGLQAATTAGQQLGDVVFLTLVQGLPVPLLMLMALGLQSGMTTSLGALLILNVVLMSIRAAMLAALATAYERRHWTYWLSPLADPAAACRIAISSLRRPRAWRGRVYA